MWLSPWWLKYVDTVWMQHCADFGYNKEVVAYEPRDWAMTYRDAAIHQNLHGDRSQFPASGIMTIGIIDGKRNRLGGENEPLDRWANNVVVNVGRGSMLKELYWSGNTTLARGGAMYHGSGEKTFMRSRSTSVRRFLTVVVPDERRPYKASS